MGIYDAQPATMDPREFARLVKRTPANELRTVMQGERRAAILDQLVAGMPRVFRADVAGSMRAVVHWEIGARADGGADVYELLIADGTCELSAGVSRPPSLTLSLDAVDFVKLVTGNTHPVVLVMRGRLRTKGDLAVAAKFPQLFDNPKP